MKNLQRNLICEWNVKQKGARNGMRHLFIKDMICRIENADMLDLQYRSVKSVPEE